MKYLYRILRLFFCPHKYEILQIYDVIYRLSGKSIHYHLQCKYCGKITVKNGAP